MPAASDRHLKLADYDNVVVFIMTHHGLGEFEQLVLLAIAHLQEEAYGIPIVEEIERRTGRSVARAAVYITLRRLEEKGFIASWMSDPTPERGGKGRRYAKLRPEGVRALRDARQATERMWRGLDPASLKAQ
jgi:DNA-binding PadR family transcriptional regulator